MGHIPKSLLEFKGETFLSRQLKSLQQAGAQSIHVVTGFYFQQIESEVKRYLVKEHLDPHQGSIRILRHPAPELGQQSSVRLALESIDKHCDLVLISLADQPLINEEDIKDLLTAFRERDSGKEILYPVVHQQRGHPVLLSAQAHALFLRQAGKFTCRQFIDAHPELVSKCQSDNEHYIIDIDSPDDMRRLS